jgi:hypothetical protein
MQFVVWSTALLTLVISACVAVALIVKRRVQSEGDEDSDELTWVTIFDGGERKSRAKAFRGGTWLAAFGGGELDLREAALDPGGAHLMLRAMMGGGELRVPSDWRVEVQSRSVMGGVQSKVRQADESTDEPVLRVEALSLMGGFAITPAKSEGGD